MSLIEALKAPPKRPVSAGPGAAVRAWLQTRTEEEQALVLEAAKDPAWGHRALLDLLVSHGMEPVSENTMREWRVSVGWRKT